MDLHARQCQHRGGEPQCRRHLTDSFTVTTVDGTAPVVTITIHGATDADLNDFDALATRTTVTSEPPFVYGTTGDDSYRGRR